MATTDDTSDLRELVERPGPFLTLLIPSPSDRFGADDRFRTEQRNLLRSVSDEWTGDLEAIESELADLPHDGGASLVAIRPKGGPTFFEFIADPLQSGAATVGDAPRLAPLIEARQRTISHVVVVTDKAGADLSAFDGGTVTAQGAVEGDTEHIHRGHPGGWSQRRFQQRAENTWNENADDVADSVVAMVDEVDARIVLVVGPTRARSMVSDRLEEQLQIPVRRIETGDVDGAADEIAREVANVAASDTADLLDRFRDRAANGTAVSDLDAVTSALDEGRVETLLVHDDDEDRSEVVDDLIRRALLTDAAVHVVPSVAVLDRGAAALLRW